jgi:hypothetical protein
MRSPSDDPWLPLFFLRPNSLPNALRRVDFLRWGPSLLWAVRWVDALTVEYLRVLVAGFVPRRGGLAGAADAALDTDGITTESVFLVGATSARGPETAWAAVDDSAAGD